MGTARHSVLSSAAVRMPRPALVVVEVLCLLAACALPLRAEWQTFTVNDGLADNNVSAILEDSSGDLWFGTRDGVSRYDGVNWTTYTMADGLASGIVRTVIEDRAGNLWFGTYGGVSRYDGVSWRTYTMADGLVDNDVHAILEDSSGDLWFGTQCGLSRYDGVNWTTYTTADGLTGNLVYAIVEDSFGDLWFALYGGGVARYDGEGWTSYSYADGLAGSYAWAITEDSSGDLWFGFYGGVSCYDGSTWTTYTTADGLVDNNVLAILEDSSGDLWFGTSGGVSRYDGRSWTTYTTADGLVNNTVMAIIEDASGNLWFGTWIATWWGGGVSRYDGVSWTTYSVVNFVQGIAEDSSGDLWFGTQHGLSRYDGVSWTTYTTADGLADNDVLAILEDSAGTMWFGTKKGLSSYDGASWTTYTTADGLAGDHVWAMAEDSSGNLWFGVNHPGLSRYDGVSWVTYTTADGLASDYVWAITEDSSGNLWFGTFDGGVSRYDGMSWVTYTTADGLVSNSVTAIIEDGLGNLWFGTLHDGVSRYDGGSWTTYTTDDGLVSNSVNAIIEDGLGNLWFGTDHDGVSRYDGASWTAYTTIDGLVNDKVTAIIEDASGNLWFATEGGLSEHEPDRVAPQTIVWPRPPLLTSSRVQHFEFTASHGESWQVQFSHALDGFSWSDWASSHSWVASGLPDGVHVFEVRAKDGARNVDSTPATVTFEVDATPPVPIITAPAFGEAVRDSISIHGTAADSRFLEYAVEARVPGSDAWGVLTLSSSQVVEGALAGWNTALVSDGDYELRLSVKDTLGLTGVFLIAVSVDNEPPYIWETTPAVVSAASGGDVYTTNAEAHLYFPPHAFSGDATVTVEPAEGVAPDSLDGGARLVLAGYAISWDDVDLLKPATLELSLAGIGDGGRGDELSFYVLVEGEDWRRLGGTAGPSGSSISSGIEDEGVYAVYMDSGAATGEGLSALTFTPRVFSPSGGFARDEVSIGFTLGRAGPVTVKIYNRAGRLVKELASGVEMTAGSNLVRWEGRDDAGSVVPDGLYLISVEADGESITKTLAVVR